MLLGGKINRTVIGLALDLTNISVSNVSNDGSSTAFLLAPTLQYAAARSSDARAELFIAARLGVVLFSESGSSSGPPPGFNYRLGLGARYWAHPNFALNVQSGFAGAHASSENGSSSSRILTLYTSLGVLSVF